MERYSNYELNSFLTTLTEQWDEPAAQAIVNAFHALPIANNFVQTKTRTKNGASMTGHTDEAGDVTIRNQETKKVIKGESEADVARVGYYKVKHHEYEEGVLVIAWHHWASEFTKSVNETPAPSFGVEYSRETLKPLALIRWDSTKQEGARLSARFLLKIIIYSLRAVLQGETFQWQFEKYVARPQIIFGRSKLIKAVR